MMAPRLGLCIGSVFVLGSGVELVGELVLFAITKPPRRTSIATVSERGV
jgi:hypothetical protein